MYIALEVTKKGDKKIKSYEEERKAIGDIELLLKQHGYNVSLSASVLYSYIEEEVKYRNDNPDEFNLNIKLNENQITEIVEEVYNTDDISSEILQAIDDKIRYAIEED